MPNLKSLRKQQNNAESADKETRPNRKRVKLLCAILLLSAFFFPDYVKRPFYQQMYGKDDSRELVVSEKDFFAETDMKPFYYSAPKGTVILTPVSKYSVTAKVAYVDRYDTLWEKFAHGYDESRMLYSSISPADLFLVYASLANAERFDKCEFIHEYRLAFWLCEPQAADDELNNYHIIPATKNIRKALSIIHNKEIVYVEGLLVDVSSPDLEFFKLETGRRHGMTHKNQFAGGQYTGMCFVLYTTKIVFGGHVYE